MRRPGDKRRKCQGRSRTVPPARSAASAHCHGQRNRSVAASSIERSRVKYADYPFFQEFYHLNPSGRFRLAFKPRSSFKFYGGGNGPQALRMCGRIMDGLISSGTYIPMLKAGRLPGVVTNDDYKKCGFRRILVFSAAAHGSHRRQGSLNTRAHGGGPGRARSDFKSAVVRRDRPYVPARTSRDNFRRCAYAMLYRACPTGGCHTIIRE
jgi:hypothetical protein